MHTYLGSKRSFMHVLLQRMAHSLFIIFLRVFSYFLISFILLWSFCKVAIIVLKYATFRFAWIIFRLKNVNGNLNWSKIGIHSIIKMPKSVHYLLHGIRKKYWNSDGFGIITSQWLSEENDRKTTEETHGTKLPSSTRTIENCLCSLYKRNIWTCTKNLKEN